MTDSFRRGGVVALGACLAFLAAGCDDDGGAGGVDQFATSDASAGLDGSLDGTVDTGTTDAGQHTGDAGLADFGFDGPPFPDDAAVDAEPDAAGDATLDAEPDGGDQGVRPRDVQDEPFECTETWRDLSLGGLTLRERIIDPRCTDPAIDSCPADGERCMASKDHYVVVAPGERRGVLWVHLVGSGGEPTNATNIARVAATEGYHALGLAYMNEPSVGDRCTDLVTGMARPTACEGLVRTEILTGADSTPWVAIDRPNSIEHRLERLLVALHAEDPTRGWDAFYTEADGLQWARIAFSGFSQGGGMAGIISRDHAVARAVFFSKGAGSEASIGAACADSSTCPSGRCCPEGEEECEGDPPGGGRCIDLAPVEWSRTGGNGQGTAADRATPGARLYGIYHREETAALYSPQVFELWGMGTAGTAIDADVGPPFGDAHVLNSGLAPCAGGSFHQSMGNNAVQPKQGGCGGNVPAMIDAWRHMMTHEDP